MTFNLPSPEPINTTITITAQIGDANSLYQFWLYNPVATPEWSELQAYSPSSTCVWTPTIAGYYMISVTAQDSDTGTEVSGTAWYMITGGPCPEFNINASPASPQPANTPINLIATVEGANVLYQFWLYNPATAAWSQLQAYSSSSTCVWTPTAAGSYLISATAQDEVTGVEIYASAWYTVTGIPLPGLYLSKSVSPSSASAGSTVTYTLDYANTGNGTATNVQIVDALPEGLEFMSATGNAAYDGTTGLLIWSLGTLVSGAEGEVTFQALVLIPLTGAGKTQKRSDTTINNTATIGCTEEPANLVFSNTVPLTITWSPSPPELTFSPPSPQTINTPILISASATGGTDVQYQFWVYNPEATPAWSELQAYSSQNTCTWTPATADAYMISVTAQDSDSGATMFTNAWYTVTGASTPLLTLAKSVSPDSALPGHTITYTLAYANNGSTATNVILTDVLPSGVQYVANSGGANSMYDPNGNTVFWSLDTLAPGEMGQVTLQGTAPDDAPGTTVSNTATISCNENPSAVSSNSATFTVLGPPPTPTVASTPPSPQPVGTPITITVEDSDPNVLFDFWLYNPNGTPPWCELQGYSSSTTESLDPDRRRRIPDLRDRAGSRHRH